MDPGSLLKRRRALHGVDQSELAKRANTSQGQISRIEQGRTSPTVRTLERLLEALGDEMILDAAERASEKTPQSFRAEDKLFYGPFES